jgi:hypothetical protein
MVIFSFNVVFVFNALPESHIKVHTTIEQGLAGEQSVFADLFALGGVYFALCGILIFSSCMDLPNEQSMVW